MSFIELPTPDWPSLVGGVAQTEAWLAARARKLGLAAERIPIVNATARALHEAGALFHSTPESLRLLPHAARFYLDLVGLTDKTLRVIADKWQSFGLSISPETVAVNLADGRPVSEENLTAFSAFVNSEFDALYPEESRTIDLAIGTVLTFEGARIQGQVQNMTGDDAVLLLKTVLVGAMEARGHGIEVATEGRRWMPYSPTHNLLHHTHLRFGGRIVCEFVPGGNRPDVKIMFDGVVRAVGEVKGRKDLSNLWESWMPQIGGHLRTWTVEHPDAPRLFFGTIITEEMIEGITAGGTYHAGLKVFHKNGLLTAAYNLSLIAAGEPKAVAAFDALVDQLSALLGGPVVKQQA